MMLTVKQVAAQLTISATRVYQSIASGKLACHRIGIGRGAIRVEEASSQHRQWRERSRQGPGSFDIYG